MTEAAQPTMLAKAEGPSGHAAHYLDLLKRCLTGWIYMDPAVAIAAGPPLPFVHRTRALGRDIPLTAHTMVGLRRLDHLQWCIEEILRSSVPGDLIETGVWRGGASIFMRGVLKAHRVTDRRVWVADSFQGLPVPSKTHIGHQVWEPLAGKLAVDADAVRDHFARYGLLDAQVMFLEGWFHDTLPDAPLDSLALMRLDGDLYESTRDALVSLYPKLQTGGFVILDDYYFESCQAACADFRQAHGISAPIQDIDGIGAYWRKA